MAEGAAHSFGNCKSIADGLAIVVTLMAGAAQLHLRNMRRELLKKEEFMDKLRQESVEDVKEAPVESEVKNAVIEKTLKL